MKQLVSWLQTMLSRPESPVAVDQPDKPLTADPGRTDPHGSGTEDLMPDIYAEADADADTQPELQILDLSRPDVDESTGFNPYDSGVRQKK